MFDYSYFHVLCLLLLSNPVLTVKPWFFKTTKSLVKGCVHVCHVGTHCCLSSGHRWQMEMRRRCAAPFKCFNLAHPWFESAQSMYSKGRKMVRSLLGLYLLVLSLESSTSFTDPLLPSLDRSLRRGNAQPLNHQSDHGASLVYLFIHLSILLSTLSSIFPSIPPFDEVDAYFCPSWSCGAFQTLEWTCDIWLPLPLWVNRPVVPCPFSLIVQPLVWFSGCLIIAPRQPYFDDSRTCI